MKFLDPRRSFRSSISSNLTWVSVHFSLVLGLRNQLVSVGGLWCGVSAKKLPIIPLVSAAVLGCKVHSIAQSSAPWLMYCCLGLLAFPASC